MAVDLSGLNKAWENDGTIRGRFRQDLPWLQWPTVERKAIVDDDDASDQEEFKYPICTKSWELNVDVVGILLDHVDGKFVEVTALKYEATSSCVLQGFWLHVGLKHVLRLKIMSLGKWTCFDKKTGFAKWMDPIGIYLYKGGTCSKAYCIYINYIPYHNQLTSPTLMIRFNPCTGVDVVQVLYTNWNTDFECVRSQWMV